MTDLENERGEWVERMRTGAEISLAVSMAILGVLDALDRRRALTTDRPEEPSLLPVPITHNEEEAL